MNKKKYSYYLPPSFCMYDMCYCMANCKKDCARKQTPHGYVTTSDFTEVCCDYEEGDK